MNRRAVLKPSQGRGDYRRLPPPLDAPPLPSPSSRQSLHPSCHSLTRSPTLHVSPQHAPVWPVPRGQGTGHQDPSAEALQPQGSSTPGMLTFRTDGGAEAGNVAMSSRRGSSCPLLPDASPVGCSLARSLWSALRSPLRRGLLGSDGAPSMWPACGTRSEGMFAASGQGVRVLQGDPTSAPGDTFFKAGEDQCNARHKATRP